jgi:hypothetical protein
MPGLELAFDERLEIELDGHTLTGEKVTRTIPICGPAAFIVLKALAFGDRAEPKDAYDLVEAIADRLVEHAGRYPEIVIRALTLLVRDFAAPDSLGPRRAAAFDVIHSGDLDQATADAHGYVDDLLAACRARDLSVP